MAHMHPEVLKQHISYYQERLKWIASEKDFALIGFPEKKQKIEKWANEEYEKCIKVIELIRAMVNFDSKHLPVEDSQQQAHIVEIPTNRYTNKPRIKSEQQPKRKMFGHLWINEIKRVLEIKPMSMREIFHELVDSDTELLKEAVGQNLTTREEKVLQLNKNLSNKLNTMHERGILEKRKGLFNEFVFSLKEKNGK